MWTQLRYELELLLRDVSHAMSEAAMAVGRGVLLIWRLVRPVIVLVLNIVAALILLFEEWGWQPLSNFLARLARFPLWAKLELFIAGLPPYAALLALAIPSAVLIPAKLLGVYFLTTGHFISAGIVIFLAKIASTGLIARVFVLTKPALMQIGWFARAYEVFIPWRDALFAHIRASWVWRYGRVIKWRAKHFVQDAWLDLRPRLSEAWLAIKPGVDRIGQAVTAALREMANRIALLRGPPSRHSPPKDLL
jgi:hypothetical protein